MEEKSLSYYLDKCKEKVNDDKYNEVIDICNKAIDIYTSCEELYYQRAIAYRKQEKYEEAIKDYNKAIELKGDYADVYNERGIVYIHQGKYEEALKDYSRAIEIDSNYAKAYRNRGIVYRKQEKYEEAIKNYNKAIEIKEDYADAYNSRGIAYRQQGKDEEALKDYSKAIEIDSNYAKAYRNRGIIYHIRGKYKEALQDYSKAIEVDGNYVKAYKNRGSIYRQQGRYEEALQDYSKAIEIKNDDVDVYNNRGIIYSDQGRYEEAIKDYNKVIEIKDDYVYAYNNRGVAYEGQGKDEEAIKDYSKAIKLDENCKQAYSGIIRIYEKDYKKNKIKISLIQLQLTDSRFYNYIKEKIKEDEKKQLLSDLYISVYKLKQKMIYKDRKNVAHYTKIRNIKLLFKPKKLMDKDEKGKYIYPKLRLNNVSYMNDPTEGQVFLKLLEKYAGEEKIDTVDLIKKLYRDKSEDLSGRDILKGKNHTFLVSFSESIDTSLPMWVQYCNDGQGGCLVFKPDFFDKDDKNFMDLRNDQKCELDDDDKIDNLKEEKKYYCLYKVAYIECLDNGEYRFDKDTKKDEEIRKAIKDIIDKIVPFQENLDDNDTEMKSIIQDILDQARYLFKDQNYAHEKEVRIIKFENNGNVKYTTDTEGYIVPHVYVDIDRKLDVDEVILGPKVQNPIEISNYLYYTEAVKKVSKSSIKYR